MTAKKKTRPRTRLECTYFDYNKILDKAIKKTIALSGGSGFSSRFSLLDGSRDISASFKTRKEAANAAAQIFLILQTLSMDAVVRLQVGKNSEPVIYKTIV